MSINAYRQEYLKQLRKMNAMKATWAKEHPMVANRQATNHGGLTTFKSDNNEVTMPVKEYEVLINAQDALKEMIRGIADGEAYKESQKLKLFQVLVTSPGPMAVNAATPPKIEMTVLDTDEDSAVKEVKRILEYDGYDDLDKTLIYVNEIHGPFDKGFVIQRNGG